MPPFTVSPAAAHELLPACRLLFDDRAEQCRDLLHTEPDATALFVARDSDSNLHAAALVQAIPGALGVAWPTRGDSREAEDAVTSAACEWLRARGVKVCQAFASTDEMADMAPLNRCGFRHTTQLVMLQCDLTGDSAAIESPERGLSLVVEGPPLSPEFECTLLATHEGTQDCPELNASRTPAEILAGFTFGARSEWFLAEQDSQPVGVIMSEVDPRQDMAELTYLGMVPEFRRRGFGADLLKYAIGSAARAGALALNVSVDARNIPAMKLYARHGFVEHERREVWLASWPT